MFALVIQRVCMIIDRPSFQFLCCKPVQNQKIILKVIKQILFPMPAKIESGIR